MLLILCTAVLSINSATTSHNNVLLVSLVSTLQSTHCPAQTSGHIPPPDACPLSHHRNTDDMP